MFMPETILFSSDKITLYSLSDIYDSATNPTGTIIPRPNSLVIDPANNGLLKRVITVNETTHNSTLGPVFTSLLSPDAEDLDPTDSSVVSIIDYGNSRFYLFYDKAESPTKLNIDKKVIILGDDAAFYEINRYDSTLQKYIPISLYYDTAGVYNGTKVPLATINAGVNDAKIPTNCHTNFDINDEEIYFMFVYDYAGTQCGSIKLFARRALINNALDDNLIIEDFLIEATQMDNSGFYLFPDQSASGLVITPKLVYNSGTTKAIAIDNDICHLYGLEGFTAAYPGQEVDLLIKYFLAPTQQASGDALVVSGNTRYLMKQIKLIVKDPGTNEYVNKILAIPVYVASVNRWTLVFFLYTLNDNTVRNITANVTLSPVFDGRLMGVNQSLMMTLRIRDIFPDAESDYTYQQPIVVKLAPYSYYERYVIRDTLGDSYGVFGVDSPILPRPVIYFDSTLEKHFIPTTKFDNEATFLEAFYYKIRPLYDSSWLSSPQNPTHFTLRSATSGMLLLSAPIPIASYGQSFSLINVDQQNQLLGANCVVEFLRYEQSQYKVLFGAPCDIYNGTFV